MVVRSFLLTLMSSAKLNRSGAVVPRARLQVLDAVADEAGAGELRARPPRVEAEHPTVRLQAALSPRPVVHRPGDDVPPCNSGLIALSV